MIKTVVAATLAMIAADQLQLQYATAAGIIAILSVGNTKKTTLNVGVGRLASLAMATMIAYFCFTLFGYTAVVFGLFLLLFIPLADYFKLTDGIVVNSVLITHFLIEKEFTLELVRNEFLLMILGVGIALLFNLYMPDKEENLKDMIRKLEDNFREMLFEISEKINRPEMKTAVPANCHQLLNEIIDAQKQAQLHRENHWKSDEIYYESYFSMRRVQLRILLEMVELLEEIQVEEILVEDLRLLLQYSATTFSEKNDGQQLLKRIQAVYDVYQMKDLPASRYEFENRARLFQFLQLFKSFVEVKVEFFGQNEVVE